MKLIIIYLVLLNIVLASRHQLSKNLKVKSKETINLGNASYEERQKLSSYMQPRMASSSLGIQDTTKRHYSFIDDESSRSTVQQQQGIYYPEQVPSLQYQMSALSSPSSSQMITPMQYNPNGFSQQYSANSFTQAEQTRFPPSSPSMALLASMKTISSNTDRPVVPQSISPENVDF